MEYKEFKAMLDLANETLETTTSVSSRIITLTEYGTKDTGLSNDAKQKLIKIINDLRSVECKIRIIFLLDERGLTDYGIRFIIKNEGTRIYNLLSKILKSSNYYVLIATEPNDYLTNEEWDSLDQVACKWQETLEPYKSIPAEAEEPIFKIIEEV